MIMNSQNPSHYCEHTRQQEGWTVLAPEPEGPELPPLLYTPDAGPPVHAASAAPDGVTLNFEYPINSNIVRAKQVMRSKKYGRNIPFAVGYVKICRLMGLDPSSACLGYKWDNERVNVLVCQLANDDSVCEDAKGGFCHQKSAPTAVADSAKPTGTKHKSAGTSGDSNQRKTFNYTRDYRELRARLLCATHKNQLCYVLTVNGHHHWVEPQEASLWAKEISVGKATLNRPPENIVFEDYFLPEGKKSRRGTTTGSDSNMCALTIHVMVNTGTSGSTSVVASPPR
ncbi:hypothetical protein B0H10DRAFT_1948247 [Mycena sp. CBHHK59/15]|nr:hypothetical protein B0H10DRAFT_1948247 [Mycena sp. CBHHK59/15]